MSLTDPIADMLTRIRNAAGAGLATVEMPHSKMRAEIARVLKQEGFITDFTTVPQDQHKDLRIILKYSRARASVIQGIRRISTPGLRRYAPTLKIPKVVGGMGVAILSTSHGLMTDRQARKSHLGGELLCYVW
ncbi:MAG: 30S ribosomal protein S8 [bacterium]